MATPSGSRRELAYRENDGIEVSLFWSKTGNRVTVEVVEEQSGEGFEFDVDGAEALDAFNHPYAYAAARGIAADFPFEALAV